MTAAVLLPRSSLPTSKHRHRVSRRDRSSSVGRFEARVEVRGKRAEAATVRTSSSTSPSLLNVSQTNSSRKTRF